MPYFTKKCRATAKKVGASISKLGKEKHENEDHTISFSKYSTLVCKLAQETKPEIRVNANIINISGMKLLIKRTS